MAQHQPIVEELISLLELHPDLTEGLKESLKIADRPDAPTLEAYYSFLDNMVTLIPTARNLLASIMEFYYLIDHSTILKDSDPFQRWVVRFARDWGNFLDTPASAQKLDTLYADPSFHIEDYVVAPSGWRTFNQFFARQIRPGKRPITSLCDDSVVVSPADSVYQGSWEITEHSTITAKGIKHSVLDLLDGSPYRDAFRGGTFTHSFLNVNDYHRFHVPVAGTVKELRNISGRAVLDVTRDPDGSLGVVDGTGYQFRQQRGLLVLDSPVGLVAVLPIGMAQVSSVVMTPEEGAWLHKGQEFGYFLFGGSDIITLYQADRVRLTADIGTHYLQGQTLGTANTD
ncbi:phosphatidylserine decarboxylase [Natronospirillum operosum]|uniref:Phosphatidylserine decarboxylase n=1 Tax=Natronospirillum operosum TaxID=2759953 RepID=A0A4Z0WGS7_9GAMM|nr:phosphatidylserine decarboxylase [Natronospirillum operosum]TGG95167.1 phosphatidylserine decarboxylase [Natronospirillum operosum]